MKKYVYLFIFALLAITILLTSCGNLFQNYSEGLEYKLTEDGTGYIVVGIGDFSGKDLIIPAEYQGKPVLEIGNNAFANSEIESVKLPKGLKIIGYYAFESSNINEISIPNSVEIISDYAFRGCLQLAEMTIGSGVTEIGFSALASTGVKRFQVSLFNSNFKSLGGNLYTKDGKKLIQYACGNEATSFKVPWGVEIIGPYSFEGARNLEKLTMSNTVKIIEEGAIGYMDIKHLDLGNGLKAIGNLNIVRCENLECVKIPDSVKTMGIRMFSFSINLEEVYLGKNVANLPEEIFENTPSLVKIFVNDKNPNYKSVDGNLYTKDGKSLIRYAPGRTDTEFVVPMGVEIIEKSAFYDAGYLEKVTLQMGVKRISEYAFGACISLKTIDLPFTVTSIGSQAFLFCDSLEVINYDSTQNAFRQISKHSGWDYRINNRCVILCIDGEYKR